MNNVRAVARAVTILCAIPVVLCLSTNHETPRALRKVSSFPLAFTIDHFCDASTCADLQSDCNDARLKFATMIASELFHGHWGPNDGLRRDHRSFSDTNSDTNNSDNDSLLPEGLHVDTNNDSIMRSVTAILYLNNVEKGGATVFPLADCADDDPAFVAATRLLASDATHTRGSAGSASVQSDDASLLEAAATIEEKGLHIQPETGRLLLFFSRTADGAIDPRSWHGGARLQSPVKNILTLFKEGYYNNDENVDTTTFDSNVSSLQDYLAPQVAEQRQRLQDLAAEHACYFEE